MSDRRSTPRSACAWKCSDRTTRPPSSFGACCRAVREQIAAVASKETILEGIPDERRIPRDRYCAKGRPRRRA
jgi:hypothetical protein